MICDCKRCKARLNEIQVNCFMLGGWGFLLLSMAMPTRDAFMLCICFGVSALLVGGFLSVREKWKKSE